MDGEHRDDAGRVRPIALPPDARALSTLARIDYADAFVVATGPTRHRTAEEWSRAILEDAPDAIRHRLRSGWSRLGLKLDRSDRSVLGWEIQKSTTDFVLLGADSRIGMRGELLFKCRQDSLLFATLLRHDNLIARLTWTTVVPAHLKIARQVLDPAVHEHNP